MKTPVPDPFSMSAELMAATRQMWLLWPASFVSVYSSRKGHMLPLSSGRETDVNRTSPKVRECLPNEAQSPEGQARNFTLEKWEMWLLWPGGSSHSFCARKSVNCGRVKVVWLRTVFLHFQTPPPQSCTSEPRLDGSF